MSFTLIATRSWPTVSCLFNWKASLSLVPTPSVPDTSTGSLYFFDSSNSAPKPPMPPSTSGRIVRLARGFMRSTRASPASMSTPASRYDRGAGGPRGAGWVSLKLVAVGSKWTGLSSGTNAGLRAGRRPPGGGSNLRPQRQVATFTCFAGFSPRAKSAILLEMTMPRADRLQTFAWTAAALAIAGLFWLLGPILTPFVIAAVFAYICDPAVNWMTARRVPRALAVLLVIVALGLALIALALILVPMVYREAMMLIRRLPDLVEMFNAQVAPILQARLGIELQLDAA